jgi:hypothetical protein
MRYIGILIVLRMDSKRSFFPYVSSTCKAHSFLHPVVEIIGISPQKGRTSSGEEWP